MSVYRLAIAVPALLLTVACNQNDADDRLEQAAEQSAAAAGDAVAALGLTERQLLDADLYDTAGIELGDVEQVARNTAGQVDRLLIEIEDSNPDRYVYVPVEGLTVMRRGNDIDLSTTMTAQQLAAMPAVDITTLAPAAAP